MSAIASSGRGRAVIAGSVVLWVCGLAMLWVSPAREPAALWGSLAASYFLVWGVVLLVSGRPRLQVAQRLLLTTVAVAAPVGLLEMLGALRLADYRLILRTHELDYTPLKLHPLNHLDRELIHRLPAYARLEQRSTVGGIAQLFNLPPLRQYDYDYRMDRNGFRNERDLDRADIVMLGDSMLFGKLVPDEAMMSSRVAGKISRTVANLSQCGYGPQQQLVVLKRYGLPLKPRVCVWAFFEGNDLTDVHRYRRITDTWDSYARRQDSLRSRSFTRNALLRLRSLAGSTPRYTRRAEEVTGHFPDPDGSASPVYFLYPAMPEAMPGTLLPSPRRALPYSVHRRQAFDVLRSVLSEAHQLCVGRDIELMVVFIPTKFRVYEQLCTFSAGTDMHHWKVDDLPGELQRMTRDISSAVRYIDLTPGLTEAARQGIQVYWPDDTHWSVDGNRIAAEILSVELADMMRRQIAVSGTHYGEGVNRRE